MKIAIIDTGLDPRYYDKYCSNLKIHFYHNDCWESVNGSSILSDDHGHGTAVFSVISKALADSVEYYIVKLDDSNGCVSSFELTCSLHRIAEEITPEILCIAIASTMEQSHDSENLKAVCDSLRSQGSYIIAPFCNDKDEIGEPASFASVVGVCNDIDSSPRIESNNGNMQIIENTTIDYIPCCNLSEFRGNSLACAVATTKMAKVLMCKKDCGDDDFDSLYKKTCYLSIPTKEIVSLEAFQADLDYLNCNRLKYRNTDKYFFEKYSDFHIGTMIPPITFCYCNTFMDVYQMLNGEFVR